MLLGLCATSRTAASRLIACFSRVSSLHFQHREYLPSALPRPLKGQRVSILLPLSRTSKHIMRSLDGITDGQNLLPFTVPYNVQNKIALESIVYRAMGALHAHEMEFLTGL